MSVDPIKTAYRAADLLRVCALAAESEAPAMAGDDRAQVEAISIAGNMVGDIIDTLEAAQRPSQTPQASDSPSATFGQWKALRATKSALVEINGGNDPDTPEFAVLDKQEEAFATEIANATPTTQADCAAMLEWIGDDGDGQMWCDLYSTAHASVVTFLKGGAGA